MALALAVAGAAVSSCTPGAVANPDGGGLPAADASPHDGDTPGDAALVDRQAGDASTADGLASDGALSDHLSTDHPGVDRASPDAGAADRTMPDSALAGCESSGLETATGLCAVRCGAHAACDGLAPPVRFETCGGAGHPAVRDRCNASCQLVDRNPSGAWCSSLNDCTGDERCEGIMPGTGGCDADCQFIGTSGSVRVYLNGQLIFDVETAVSFLHGGGMCTNTPARYCGPATGSAVVTDEHCDDPSLAYVEFEMTNVPYIHEGCCDEKWIFFGVEGAGGWAWLQKWNWRPEGDDSCPDIVRERQYTIKLEYGPPGGQYGEPIWSPIYWEGQPTHFFRIEWD